MQFDNVEERVVNIRYNKEELDKFIREYKPFIAACTKKYIGRYVRFGEDDELSIALLAFNNAIMAFDKEKGKFLSFASLMIRRKLIDYYRSQKEKNANIAIESSIDNHNVIDFSLKKSIQKYNEEEEAYSRKQEIIQLSRELSGYEISFIELPKVSPKHKRVKMLCKSIIEYILLNDDILDTVHNKRYLPMKKIEKELKVSKKKFEKYR